MCTKREAECKNLGDHTTISLSILSRMASVASPARISHETAPTMYCTCTVVTAQNGVLCIHIHAHIYKDQDVLNT